MKDLSDRPLCKCHGEPMIRRGAGYWRCRVKMAVYNKAWREANPEYYKAWREANPEYYKAWYEANGDRHRAAAKAWREANREHRLAYNAAWYEANRERSRAYDAARYADPIRRIERNMQRAMAKRRKTIERRKAALEAEYGRAA